MAKKNAAASVASMDDVDILIIGPNVWGRAKTFDGALQNATRPKTYQAFVCHRDTRVDDMGHISYPKAFVPREIFRKGHTVFASFNRD